MSVIDSKPTRDTPEVNLEITSGAEVRLTISGNSYPANSQQFYKQILDWFEENLNSNEIKSVFIELYFHYINTSSTKLIIRLLELLEGFYSRGNKCHVLWRYDADDGNIRDIGEDMRNFVNVPFELTRNG